MIWPILSPFQTISWITIFWARIFMATIFFPPHHPPRLWHDDRGDLLTLRGVVWYGRICWQCCLLAIDRYYDILNWICVGIAKLLFEWNLFDFGLAGISNKANRAAHPCKTLRSAPFVSTHMLWQAATKSLLLLSLPLFSTKMKAGFYPSRTPALFYKKNLNSALFYKNL